jgi:hypothetical protein
VIARGQFFEKGTASAMPLEFMIFQEAENEKGLVKVLYQGMTSVMPLRT